MSASDADDAAKREIARWRLVLGKVAEPACGACLNGEDAARDAALEWLYGRDEALEERGIRRDTGEQGGHGPSQMTVPTWINDVHRLFPKETIERLERDAVEKFHIHEVVTNAEVLERVEPNPALLRAVLLTKHLMDHKVLALAKELVRKVVRELVRKLAREVKQAFSGTRARHRSRRKSVRDFDARGTIRTNMRHVDAQSGRLVIREPLFWSRTRRTTDRWQVIVVVDQSGSMVSSVIHAAVTAACLWGLPAIKTHLVAFDTEVIDLTRDAVDPVETLMKVQLGGGTDIAKAVRYAEGLVENPRRTMVVLISDLFEGGDADALVRSVKRMHEQGVRFLALAALDEEAEPTYDRELGKRLANVGAYVGAMTPSQLVHALEDVLR